MFPGAFQVFFSFFPRFLLKFCEGWPFFLAGRPEGIAERRTAVKRPFWKRADRQAHRLLRLSWLRAISPRARGRPRPNETGNDPPSSSRPSVCPTSLLVGRFWPRLPSSASSLMLSTWDRRTGSTCSSATQARTCLSFARHRQRVGQCSREAYF